MPVVDTNLLVALLDNAHEDHGRAVSELAEKDLIVTLGTIQEFAGVARRRAKDAGQDGSAVARAAVHDLVTLAGFQEAPVVPRAAILGEYQAHLGLSFPDAWSLAVALQMREQLLTYDKKLKAAYATRRT